MISGYDDDDENLSDEDYLINQARKYLSLDRATAKSWMIAAKSVFPTSFNIQYESYQMARQCGNVQEAAEDFHELIKVFPNERVLWHEMQKIADFLRSDVCTEDASFYRALFNDLSSDVQHDMLVSVADHCEDTMEHCRIILLLLQKFPNKALQHGVKLIDTLFAAEKHSRCALPVNQYRRLLVCDVLPLIFVSPSVILPTKTMFRLLHKAIEFYICYITLPANTEAEQAFKSENLLNDPWQQLFQFLKLAGHKLDWDMVDTFSTVGDLSLSELNWQKMWAVLHKKQSYSEPADMSMASGSSTSAEDTMTLHVKEVFFCTVVMYFHSLYQFGKLICPEWFSGSNTADTHYILIEGIQSKEDPDQLKSRKRRVDGEMKDSENILQLTVSKSASPEVANTLTQSFVMAIKCWEILHDNSLRKEFNRLSQHLRMEEWPWFQEFFIDSIIYQGYHKEAVPKLIHILGSATDEFTKNKASLQLASCSYYVGDFYKACKYLFDVICTFTQPFASSCSTVHYDAQPKRTGHHMHFIAFKHAEVLQYCVKLLITVFKEKALRSTAKDCMCLGHLLVLLQYDWPQEEKLFLKCIDVIKKEGSFCYGLFFNYIVKSDMLEEFMFLTTPAGGTISLDLLPTSTVQIGKQRAVTRGVNKGAKEDLRGNMEKQMARCDEDLNNLLVTFIKQERDLLMQNIV